MEGKNGFHFNTEGYFEAFVLHVACYVVALQFHGQVFDVGGVLVYDTSNIRTSLGCGWDFVIS